MSRELHCSDTGMKCDFIAKGESDDEVMGKASQHVMQDHGPALSALPEEERNKLMATARAAIHDTSSHDQPSNH